ncbi:lipase 1-like [Coccinella septempunctata]|uniref:lipase 1-like n=1 Tax=Coccinella septempunctata TaxID=41139 RepID=UPI001D07283D|nr:lipase 1-like [Coccinella septempunctata]
MEIDSCSKIDYLIKNRGFPLEIHTVTTEDGYILSMFRIRQGKNGSNSSSSIKPPVLIMHGMFCSACDYLLNEYSLPYYLADHGFDVWLGNSRGTPFSRKHNKWDCNKDRKKYWDFSYHEIGYYDIPAFIDYIVKNTGVSRIYYIGHSQGTTNFFVLMSTRPEYNAKIRLGIMLAAAAVGHHVPTIPSFEYFIIPYLKLMLHAFGPFEYSFLNNMRAFVRKCCSQFSWFERLVCCFIRKYFSFALTPSVTGNTSIRRFLTFTPTALSAKQVIHYGQAREVGLIRYFNYGTKKNVKVYGCAEPPSYDFSQISSPLIIFVGGKDVFGVPEDLDEFIGLVGPNAKKYWIERKDYRHFDFLLAEDSPEMVNKPILNFLNEYTDANC